MKNYPTVEHVQKTTAFKTKTRAQGAIETLKWLEDGAPHKLDGLKGTFSFDMGTFVTRMDDIFYHPKNNCGTSCCIAGAIYAFSKKLNGDKKEVVMACIDDVFGTDVCAESHWHNFDLSNLFYALTSGKEDSLERITPKEAAITLRKYLEEGIVDWSHVK